MKGMDVCYTTCTNVCDSFRMETLQGETWTWEDMETHANTVIERFVRTCKFRVQ